MIKVIQRMPVGTIGLEASGKVTEEDYRDVLVPAVTLAREQGRVRLLYLLGDGFESFSAGAMWADAKVWAKNLDGFERIAVVSDADWLEHLAKAVSLLMDALNKAEQAKRQSQAADSRPDGVDPLVTASPPLTLELTPLAMPEAPPSWRSFWRSRCCLSWMPAPFPAPPQRWSAVSGTWTAQSGSPDVSSTGFPERAITNW